LSELCSSYITEQCVDKSPRTKYNLGKFCDQLLRELGDPPLAALTPDVLRAWKLALSQRLKSSTVRCYMGFPQ
jgi:hypothetical protein